MLLASRQAAVRDPRRRRLGRQGLRRHPERFAEAFDLPVGVSFRRQDYFDNTHRCYAGHVGISVAPPLSERVRDADLLLLIGTRLGEASSRSYTLIDVPEPRQTLVHVHPGAEEIGLVYTPDLSIHAGRARLRRRRRAALQPVDSSAWRAETERAHEQYLAALTPPPTPGALQLGEVLVWLREHLPADAIVTNGAGNYCVWVNGYYQYRGYRTQLGPTSGSMGYGTPGGDRRQARPSRAHRGRLRRRRLPPDDRPGARDRGAVRPARSSGAWSTTACTARSACTRSATIPAAWSAPISRTPTSPRWRAPMAAMARWSSAPRTSPPPSGAPSRRPTFALLDLRVDPEAMTPRYSISQIRAGALSPT